jgi:hypothetical protein
MNQASKEVPGVTGENLTLPCTQHDAAVVLATRAVLGEEAGPVLPERRDLVGVFPSLWMYGDTARWNDLTHCELALSNDRGIPSVEDDPQAVNTPRVL